MSGPEAVPLDDDASPDELGECLVLAAGILSSPVTLASLTAGLPLENGRLSPVTVPRAAARAGLQVFPERRSLARIKPGLLPALLVLEDEAACLLISVDRKRHRAQVLYPESGDQPITIPLADLQAIYTGRLFYLKPEFQFDDRTPPERPWRGHWFWSVIRKNRRLYFDVMVAAFLINVFAVAMPLFVMNVYDRVVPNQAFETLWVLAAGIGLVLVADFMLRTMRTWFVDRAAVRADNELSARIMTQIMGMRMEYRPASAGSFAATVQAFESVRGFFGSAVVVALVDLPFVLLFTFVIFLIGMPLAIPVAIGIVVALLFGYLMQRRMQAVSEQTMRASAQRNASLVESLVGIEDVRAFQAEGRIQNLWERTTAFLARLSARNRLFAGSIGHFAQWAQHTVAISVIIIGVYLLGNGDLTQGGLIAAYMLSSRAMGPVSQAAGLIGQYHQAASALSMLNKLMELPVERPPGKQWVSRPALTGDIEFRDVSFRYPDESEAALGGVSFRISAGEHVGVLGRNGSGKSTLHRLLMGFYQVQEGAILLDGVDIRQFDPSELRRQLGYVPQDVSLFYGSVYDNIIMGHAVSTDALHRSASLSGLDKLLKKHPKGYELPVGESGRLLSGGQRQSVGLVRAFVHDPRLLLLDEPTAAMDHAAEEDIKRQLKTYSAGKSMLLVTHRTSLLELVDRIIVLDNGTVLADGPKDEVINALRSGQIRRAT